MMIVNRIPMQGKRKRSVTDPSDSVVLAFAAILHCFEKIDNASAETSLFGVSHADVQELREIMKTRRNFLS